MSGLSLYEMLSKYASSDIIPMHMPGHKRNNEMLGTALPYLTDITEIPGFDNLQNPEGILKQTSELAAGLYGSKRAFLSVNGSTGAILAAVHACTKPYDKVIMARNCHKSVYNAMEISMLRPVYISTPVDTKTGITGSIEPAQVRDALIANPDASLVIITSPTYEGVGSDIRRITNAAHECQVPVLIDAAHGAHLGFSDFFGESAVQAGADLTVMSLHKTLPALTQCALLHLQGGLVNEALLQNAINTFQTSSPSYILLSSIDACLSLIEAEGRSLFAAYEFRLRKFIEEVKKLNHLNLFHQTVDNHSIIYSFDPGKVVILTHSANIDGPELSELLRMKYSIETEMTAPGYVVAMTSICDTDENFSRLAAALLDIDSGQKENISKTLFEPFSIPKAMFAPYELTGEEGEPVVVISAAGRVSLEYVWAYPPGIPLITPGEVIPEWFAEKISGVEIHNLHSTRGVIPPSIYCRKK